jgi:hypothetical protein
MQEREEEARLTGMRPFSVPLVHEKGPIFGVDWCVPLLPGVLLADSYYSVGPLYARGGVKIVVWYGVGSLEGPLIWGWLT